MIVRTAQRIDEVKSVLEFAEREARHGSHVAVMLSYEAAPAFDPAFVTHAPSDVPLAWAAVLNHASVGEQIESYSSTEWEPLITRDEYDRSSERRSNGKELGEQQERENRHGSVPQHVHRVLVALGDAETAPQRAQDADDQADVEPSIVLMLPWICVRGRGTGSRRRR